MQAGLGRRTATIDESTTHEELCDALKVLFPKLETVTGGWLLYKSSGGWGSRKLTILAPDDTSYTGRILKAASRGGKNLFIAPIQEELSTTPLQLTDKTFSNMPKEACQKCGVAVPLQLLLEHVKSCAIINVDTDEHLDDIGNAQILNLTRLSRRARLLVSPLTFVVLSCPSSSDGFTQQRPPLLPRDYEYCYIPIGHPSTLACPGARSPASLPAQLHLGKS
nr:uncharacterized protein LOC111833701 [Paramormyrops kingsleyae]